MYLSIGIHNIHKGGKRLKLFLKVEALGCNNECF